MKKIVFFVAILLLVSFKGSFSQDEFSGAIEKRLEISGRLDSLELEKQKLKRTGKSFKELEKLSAALRDSIEMLRENMPIITEKDIIESKKISKSAMSIFKPKSLFDWLILIAGGAAILSGVILIFGVISSIKNRGKGKSTQNATLSQKLSANRNGLLDIPISKEKPVNLPKETPKQDIDGINKLREKIQASSQTQPSASPFERQNSTVASMPPSANNNQNTVLPKTSPSLNQTQDLKNEILKAARAGQSESEIAQKLKISVDQVSLVLKMSDGSMRGV